MMLARADTPDAVLLALDDAADGPPRTVADFRDQTTQQARSTQASVYTLMAICCLLVALLVLATAVARQRVSWLRDVASLRVVGVDARRLRRAGLWEVVALTVATVVGSVVGAVLAVRLLLPNLALVRVPEHAVPLRTSLAVTPVLLAAAAVALVVLVVAGRGRSITERSSRPALLREEVLR
jgi:predicted lysophospholipase L1 biosynthesis ABC-type transport system permease subunit